MSVRHFLDIDGAATLPTEQLSLVDQAVADLVATRAMGAVHGQAGLGKTFAVEAALARRTKSRFSQPMARQGPSASRT